MLGGITINKKKEYAEGTVSLHPKGFAFVTAFNTGKYPLDIFIPFGKTGTALDGDEVKVLITAHRKKGPEGIIEKVTKRKHKHLYGTIVKADKKEGYYLHITALGEEKLAFAHPVKKNPYKVGDRVKVTIEDWGDKKYLPTVFIKEVLGSIYDPQIDNQVASLEYAIPDAFPKEVLKELESLPDLIELDPSSGREDCTHLLTMTIDPDTAKDFDDAISVERTKDGYLLGVHIADVSHFVKQGSALDAEAIRRANSTYFPGKCYPMLPEKLSNDLCSLRPDESRFTVSIFMNLSTDGELTNYRIAKTMIRSRKRFTYKEAKRVLDKEEKSPYLKELELMVEVCQKLKQQRFARGSVDLVLDEPVLIINKKGEPVKFEIVEYDITHQMVEEFMLKTNEVIAGHMLEKSIPCLFRIHETPENLSLFVENARRLGYQVPDKPTPEEVQAIFDEAKGTRAGKHLSISYIRSMKIASYSDDNVGHFGLCLDHYAHWTSPIRRYPDLVLHRAVFDNQLPKSLPEVANLCSTKERESEKAEKSVKQMKKLRFLNKLFEKDPTKTYPATITSIKPFGFFFEIEEFPIEGFIHLRDHGGEYFHYNEQEQSLTGRNSKNQLLVYSPIAVQIREADLLLQEISWKLLE
ncbi:MAG: Ribonuclease R [Chlamydiia bacterium]|nr:Ribonuclease R [Chlamydiia bacterium]